MEFILSVHQATKTIKPQIMKAIFLLMILFINGIMYAQNQKPITAKLDKAVVYLQGAHLYYGESVSLAAGNNDLIFENISPYLNDASLQASSKGGVVMDVKHNLKYREKAYNTRQYDKEIEQMFDSIEEVNYQSKDIDNKLKVLATEKNMLLSNRIIRGEPQRDSLPLLRDGMLFLKEKLNSIYEQELKWDRAKNKVQKKMAKLNERYKALLLLQSGEVSENNSEAQPIHQVIVTVFSENATTAQISFNYFIQNANWIPQYDLQASSQSNAFQLKYFANITQNSGLDWKNTLLTLSTSNPNESNVKPEMSPWYLSFIQYQQLERKMKTISRSSNAAMGLSKETLSIMNDKNAIADTYEAEDQSLTDYITNTENLIRTEYEIKLAYTINNDGKAHKVLINQHDVPMQLQFGTVPKICGDAFLFARVTGWEDMNIIPGNARLYFDGGYVGEIYLTANSTNDTINVNLGRDKSIAITRKKIKEKYKSEFIGDHKTETRTIEIVVRNTKNIPVEIVVEDQIPVVHGTEEIKVVLVQGNGAILDEPSGKLKWNLKLGSKETKKILFTYEVRYPKSKGIAGL